MPDYVYRITIWDDNENRPWYKPRRNVRLGLGTRRVKAVLNANKGMKKHVAIERAVVGPFSEVSALFGTGPDRGEGTWLAVVGPEPVRRAENQ